MAGVEEAEEMAGMEEAVADIAGMEVMTVIKDMKIGIRKERRNHETRVP